ncbi:MAG TPA: adenylate/guanylate cyclase domain-containing protein [Burkholderiales bacterium]|nr:adenylate/guanylate cyclase domain-containing protein [Burkholderiales bacterium]
MLERGNRTFTCSVVFADIVEYSKKPVADQMKLKDEFNSHISEVIKDVATDDRIILDTGDGVAISFLGAPEEALFVAMNLRDALASNPSDSGLSARIGINLGPVRVVKDINGQPNIIGDGINIAQRVMSFAQPGEVLVSRSYYEVVSHLSQEYSLLFEYQGARADKHVREHEVYAVGTPGRDVKLWTAGSKIKQHGEAAAQGTDSSLEAALTETVIIPKMRSVKKILYVGSSLAVVVMLALLVLRGGNSNSETEPSKPTESSKPQVAVESKSAKPAQSTLAPAPATQDYRRSITVAPQATPEARKTVPAPKSEASKLAEAAPATAALPASHTGSIALAINPWGEVYLDGKKIGVSPPLKELQVAPGKHTVEIKNTSFASHTETLEVKLDDRLKIKHEFR